ncbi:MAG: hypothetical protein WBX25_11610 [Rhodomicrobium sp.]
MLEIVKDDQVVAKIERDLDSGVSHTAYTLSPYGSFIVSGGSDGLLVKYSRDGKEVGRFVGHEDDISAVAISADGNLLISSSADHTIRLWNLKS